MRRIELAKDVYLIPLFPRHAINVYLIGSVLVDGGIRMSANKILQATSDRTLSAHVLTHAHPDHQGSSAQICQQLNLPLGCHAADRQAAETGNLTTSFSPPNGLIARLQQRFMAGAGHPVSMTLKEGDWVEDFQVIETPGHTPGHIGFWREKDGVLIAGDVLANMSFATTLETLLEPPNIFTEDPVQNRHSIRKIADLAPRIVGFGHGPALRNPQKLKVFAQALPP